MTARPSADQHVRPLEIAIVGSDLLLAALPGRPLQLAHAIHACGYDLVIPASWGDELVARYGLEALDHAGSRPMVFSACPKVRSRLMASGTELLPHLISCIAPPAATARYLRALQPDVRLRVTYIGGCPGAADTSIDVCIPPAEFLATLEARGIAVLKQPLVFESVIPPDRRRHLSLPGGVPAPELTATHGFHYSLLIESDDLAAEIAEHLLAIESVLVDPGPGLGCFCAGAADGGSREAVVALEPPRASFPVIEEDVLISLDLPVAKATLEEDGTIAVVDGEPVSSQEVPDQGPSDVPSMPDAKRGAARRRIAVTPAHARPVTAQSVSGSRPEAPRISESAMGQGTTEHERAVPVDDSHEPGPSDGDADVADAPAPPPSVAAPIAVPEEPTPMSTPSDLPLIVTRLAGRDPSPETVPATGVAVRHRTPVYGILHASRGTAHQRVVARQGIAVPRAYNAIRHRSGEVVTVTAPMEMSEPPIHGHQVVSAPEAVVPSGTANGNAALTGPVLLEHPSGEEGSAGPRPPGRRDARRIETQGIGRQSRLWGLLMSILLIAAVTVTLLLIFGG